MGTWERAPYFDYYFHKLKCRYTVSANIDITELIRFKQERGLKFFPLFLYVIMRAVNSNKEFRMSFDASGELGYWDFVVPSYTVFHNGDKTFSDIWSEYNPDFATFYKTVVSDMLEYKDVKGIKARPEQPENYCPVSSLPWVSFTGIAQDTYAESMLLFPLIRFGKYYENGDRILLPVAVSVHHAVADGYHTGKLINDMQALASGPNEW